MIDTLAGILVGTFALYYTMAVFMFVVGSVVVLSWLHRKSRSLDS